jgi:hypothetical protein
MPTGSNCKLGLPNTASDPTEIDVPAGPSGMVVRYPGAVGVVGNQAFLMKSGVLGIGLRGVSGISLNNDGGVGVAGLGVKVGVAGDSTGAFSVGTRGVADFMGVLGTASTVITTKMVVGVHGETLNTGGIGVNGQSGSFIGVRGLAGERKTGPSPVGAGVMGIGKMGSQGVVGMATAPAFAGFFLGDLVATGAKAAAVPFPDGSRRLLYSVESPESWFEDFGTGRLVRGRGTVKIDQAFRGVVRGAYHVFLSPEGDCQGLFVARKSAGGFEVRESQGGRSSIRFSYRLIARRKDVAAPRFAKARLPIMPKGADAPVQAPESLPAPTVAEARRSIGQVGKNALRRARRPRGQAARRNR